MLGLGLVLGLGLYFRVRLRLLLTWCPFRIFNPVNFWLPLHLAALLRCDFTYVRLVFLVSSRFPFANHFQYLSQNWYCKYTIQKNKEHTERSLVGPECRYTGNEQPCEPHGNSGRLHAQKLLIHSQYLLLVSLSLCNKSVLCLTVMTTFVLAGGPPDATK